MNSDPLDRKLAAYASQSMPAAPTGISADVWREIERRRSSTRFGWSDLLARPRLAFAAIAFAVAAGVAPALAFAKLQISRRLASDSLHFDTFSTRSAAQVMSAAPERINRLRPSP